MKTTLQIASLFVVGAMALAACGDDSTSGGGGTGGATGGGGEAGSTSTAGGGQGGVGGEGGQGGDGGQGGMNPNVPPPPEPLAQIDRMGRPAINTALSGTFVIANEMGVVQTVSTNATREAAEDAYNADGLPSNWDSNQGMFAANLAILDSLDTGVGGLSNADACGNQPGYAGGACAGAGTCYALIATVLSDDVLWVDTAGVGCSAAAAPFGSGYLAVEFNALGVTNTGCGGRRPIDDVIDVTYGVVAGVPGMFGDNVAPPAGLHPELFPYLKAPQ